MFFILHLLNLDNLHIKKITYLSNTLALDSIFDRFIGFNVRKKKKIKARGKFNQKYFIKFHLKLSLAFINSKLHTKAKNGIFLEYKQKKKNKKTVV